MKWFKHYTDMHQGRSINDLMDQLGHTGLCYFLLQEMCAGKLDECATNLDESATTFQFHQRIVRQNLRISAVNLRKLLDVCAENGLLSFTFLENTLEIKMPILLNLLSRDTKLARTTRAESASKTRLDKERERDKERDKERDLEKELSTEPKNSVALAAANTPQVIFKISESLSIPIKQDLINSWADTYPEDFLREEMKKARSWILSNPHKAPKSAWSRFFNSWFSRAWEQYRKTLKSNPTKMSVSDLMQFMGWTDES